MNWKTKYIECECHSFHHVGRFIWHEKEEGLDWDVDELYFDFALISYLPWYKRIWAAIRYIFKVDDCNYDCLIMDKEKVKELRDFLNERLKNES